MMKCKTKIKHTCGTKASANCVFYNTELPTISKLKILEDCITIEETTEDLYNLIEDILIGINTEELGNNCLIYKKSKSKYNPNTDVIYIKDVLLKIEEEICKLKDLNIDSNIEEDIIKNLDFKCLSNPCDNTIGSLTELLQILINEVCNINSVLDTCCNS